MLTSKVDVLLRRALVKLNVDELLLNNIIKTFAALLVRKKKLNKQKAYARALLIYVRRRKTKFCAAEMASTLFPKMKVYKKTKSKTDSLDYCPVHRCAVFYAPAGIGGRAGGSKSTPGGVIRLCAKSGKNCKI